MSKSDLVARLRSEGALAEHRAPAISELLKAAADRIEFLELVTGAVSQGEDLAAIKKRLSDG